MSIKTEKFTTVIFEIVLVWYGHTHPFLRCVFDYTNAFTVSAEVFDRCLPVDGKTLYKSESEEQVFVFWKWKWQDSVSPDPEDNNSVEDGDEGCCSDGGESSCSDGDEQDDDDFDSSLVTHGVIFKCIGVTKDSQSQETLAVAAQKLRK